MEANSIYAQHARELESMVHNHTIVRSVTLSILALVRTHSVLKNIKKEAQNDIWWPFITKSWMDMCTYGMCAYIRRKIDGIVYPEHLPILNCNLSVMTTGEVNITPRFGKHSASGSKKLKVYVFCAEEPDYRSGRLKSPLARLLHSFKRLSQLNSMMLDQEMRITNPCLYLEDSISSGRGSSIYESVTSQNPDWQTSIPGLTMGAQDRAQQNANIDNYIGGLQEALVNTINRFDDPKAQIDELGLSHRKRKRVTDTQVPLPQGRRAVFHQPSNRTDVMRYEEWFQREVPWVFGFPLSFFENNQSKVSSNYKMMETISLAALRTQADVLSAFLFKVSRDLFGINAAVLNSPMIVRLDLIERSIDYDDAPSKTVAPPQPTAASNPEAGNTTKETNSDKKETEKKKTAPKPKPKPKPASSSGNDAH